MSIQTFELPDLGEGLTEAEVVRWLVAVGDVVVVDQPVVEVETAKSIVEVPSPYAGTVSTLHGQEGQTVDVGKPLISVDAGGAKEFGNDAEGTGSGNVLIGYGTPEGERSGRRRSRKTAPTSVDQTHDTAGRVPRVSSPLVRQLARNAGVSVHNVIGTGADGLITRRDVEAAVTATHRLVEPSSAARTGLAISKREPMSGFRTAVSAAMSRSRSEIPEATVWVDVDFTELFTSRERAAARGATVPGLLAFLARYTVAALRAHPELNGEVDADRNELIQYDGINLGFAMQTERGLVAPAILGAHEMTTAALDVELRRLTQAAREGKVSQAELSAGTFTLNNYGGFGVDGSAAIINHPQVAILGFGRIIDRPWVVDGQVAVRKIGQMSFVFDHRVCDGGVAAGFMRQVVDAIESPAQAISHL